MTLARAGGGIWNRLVPDTRGYEEGLERFAAELELSADHDEVEAALLRLARRIAPTAQIEVIRKRGHRAGAADRRGAFTDFGLRFGPAHHGHLRLHHGAGESVTGLGERNHRRLVMACRLAACALEGIRLKSSWTCDDEETVDYLPAVQPDAGADQGDHNPEVVRDATFLSAVLPFALAQSRRHGEPLSLLCIQLERLAAIRDLLGTSVADDMVRDIAETVSSTVRNSDIVARLDDDRIVVLLVRSRCDNALLVAGKIARAVAARGLGRSRLLGSSVSIGAAEFPKDGTDSAKLLQAADEAMSRSRAAGSRTPVSYMPVPDHGSLYPPVASAVMSACAG